MSLLLKAKRSCLDTKNFVIKTITAIIRSDVPNYITLNSRFSSTVDRYPFQDVRRPFPVHCID